MDRFRHLKPREVEPNLPFGHALEIRSGDELLGIIHYEYFSRPFPLYFIGNIIIVEDKRGKGYGTKLIAEFESMLKRTGKAGLLSENMHSTDEYDKRWYARRGWIQIPGTNGYVFNLPTNVSLKDIVPQDIGKRTHSDARYERIMRRLAEGNQRSVGDV